FHVQIDDFRAPSGRVFYANTMAPLVPASLGIQSITGLDNYDTFHTDLSQQRQVARAAKTIAGGGVVKHAAIGQLSPAVGQVVSGPVRSTNPNFRTFGWYPSDYRSRYDITGHNCGATQCDGSGQTVGFTLWRAGFDQQAATAYATATGDTAITVDANCTSNATATSTSSSCNTIHEAANHEVNILENSNPNTDYSGTSEVALDIEAAHGVAPNVGMKYFLGSSASGSPDN